MLCFHDSAYKQQKQKEVSTLLDDYASQTTITELH